jgi:hypothetical protein
MNTRSDGTRLVLERYTLATLVMRRRMRRHVSPVDDDVPEAERFVTLTVATHLRRRAGWDGVHVTLGPSWFTSYFDLKKT